MRCDCCGAEWESFAVLPRLLGFLAGFDDDDRCVLMQMRNCTCEATYSEPVERAIVEAAAKLPTSKISDSARDALETLELHR